MTNPQIITEQEVQASYWFTYKAANGAAVVFIIIAAWNDHPVFALFAVAGLIGGNLWHVPPTLEKFDERMMHVVFKVQVENLYVFSEFADQPDTTVVATFKRTVEHLRVVGNNHEVRVHLMIFRDVQRFTWWYDKAGKLQKTGTMREPMTSAETWEQYCDAVELFEKTDRDERLRQLRKDGAGFDWVNQNVLWQDEPA